MIAVLTAVISPFSVRSAASIMLLNWCNERLPAILQQAYCNYVAV
jgi:hypothetical protein